MLGVVLGAVGTVAAGVLETVESPDPQPASINTAARTATHFTTAPYPPLWR